MGFQLFQLLLGIDAKTNIKNNEAKHSLRSKRYTYREHLRPEPFKDFAATPSPARLTDMLLPQSNWCSSLKGPLLTCDIHLDDVAIEQALPLPSKNHSVESAFLLDDRLGSTATGVVLGIRFRGCR